MAIRLIFFFYFLLLTIKVAKLCEAAPGTVFKLIHINQLSQVNKTGRLELLTQMLQSDSNKFPLFAGGANGTGQYFAQLEMGTPAQELLMVIDTESDLTWMKCNTSREDDYETTPVFHANKSTSFSVLPCGSPMCRQVAHQNNFNVVDCTSDNDACGFSYSYERGQVAGDLANETATFDGTTTTQVLVTCTNDYSSDLNNVVYNASGILGLGINSSLRDKASSSGSSDFSYCLVETLSPINVSSYLIFGSRKGVVDIHLDQPMQYTELVPNAGSGGRYYGVNVEDVFVNGTWVNMTTEPLMFDIEGNGGVIVDSGATGTYLVEAAYNPIIAAIDAFYVDFNISNDKESIPFDVCYTKEAGSHEFPDAPKLEFVLAGGVTFAPHAESYVLSINENMTCLGFINSGTGNGSSVFGTMLQQRFLWDFGLDNNKLGFASSNCTAASGS